VKCSILAASAISAPELLHAQFRKLAINAVINPLTVVFDCLNGELFTNPAVCRLVDLLVLEISNVIQATLKSQPKADDAITTEFFEPELLQKVVHDVGRRTAKNSSSMRQDRHAGRQTEIDYINGYVASQAKLHDIRCPLNARIIELIRSNARLTFDQVDMLLAF
jgi:2-dehydropantoate 2-reductase